MINFEHLIKSKFHNPKSFQFHENVRVLSQDLNFILIGWINTIESEIPTIHFINLVKFSEQRNVALGNHMEKCCDLGWENEF